MATVIVGAGQVGSTLARMLMREHHDVILIDRDEERLRELRETTDIQAVHGHGASPQVLRDLGLEEVELLIAVTDVDEVNMISAMTAKQLGVGRTVARIRNPVYRAGARVRYTDLLGIDLVISPEVVTAQKVVEVVRTAGVAEVETFAGGRVQILQLHLTDRCPILSRPLRTFEVPAGYLLVAIEREGELLIPDGNEELRVDDRAWISARADQIGEVLQAFGTEAPAAKRVGILGSGQISRRVARDLAAGGMEVKLFEKNRERCTQLSEELSAVQVIHGDATDLELLNEEGVAEMDDFVALSRDEAQSILTALVAKTLGVKKTVALVERAGFAELVERIGVDTAVSPRVLTASAILKQLRRGRLVSVFKIREGGAEILEFVVGTRSPVAGKTLAKAGFRKGALVGAVLKGDGTVYIPRGKDVLEVGDHVIVFAVPEAVQRVERLFP
jgi:trk system potassium uptake protein TrkA